MARENSFSTSDRIRLGCLVLLPAALYAIPLRWITGEGHITLCLFKNITGAECYGCGMTRAVFSLLHFDFGGAWAYNRLVVVVFPLLVYLYAKEIVRTTKRL